MFRYLFLDTGPRVLPCGDGTSMDPANLCLLDWNGDRRLDISDGVGGLNWLYLDGPPHAVGAECQPIAGCTDGC